jgi:hypothetical protein
LAGSATGQRSRSRNRIVFALLALAVSLAGQLGPASPVARAAAPPKAVFIVGPTGDHTDSNLRDARAMAQSATELGMDVRRVFHPYATWEAVLAQIQGANLVVYMGHGYGWPSPYGNDNGRGENGFGLNMVAGGSKNDVRYYGSKPIREQVQLAPNAVVMLVHLCYAPGNGENGSIPSKDVARQRVDNYAAGFLAAGARAVFAFSGSQQLDYVNALATSDKTMDELFMTPGYWSGGGYIGWKDLRFDSVATRGATNHLDPHETRGFTRAVSGNLAMSAVKWRNGFDSTPTDGSVPPKIKSLTAMASGGGGLTPLGSADPAPFHPNGDGLNDALVISHRVDRDAFLDVSITNTAGRSVRSFTVWAAKGAGNSRWDGRSNTGRFVADGDYILNYTPRDSAGNRGATVSIRARVLTAIGLPAPAVASFFPASRAAYDSVSPLKVKVNQPAQVSWKIVDNAGATVRRISAGDAQAGTLRFEWDGRDNRGRIVPAGVYSSLVSATTPLGTYRERRQITVGAFRLTAPSAAVKRGTTVKFVIRSNVRLAKLPRLTIDQPGLTAYTIRATKIDTRRYKVKVTLKSGGTAGTMRLIMTGLDKSGVERKTIARLPLK